MRRAPDMTTLTTDAETRARLSLGRADAVMHETVAAALARDGASGTLADIGCGSGRLFGLTGARFTRRIGVDVVQYDGLPADVEFVKADLDAGRIPLPDASVDAATAIEVIEHVENPRGLVRELARITRPGGWIALTTPNQVSALSLLTLALKGQFSAFQASDYPAHRTALLPIDLERIAREVGLQQGVTAFTCRGRVPFTGVHYPRAISALWPRALSDNVVFTARR